MPLTTIIEVAARRIFRSLSSALSDCSAGSAATTTDGIVRASSVASTKPTRPTAAAAAGPPKIEKNPASPAPTGPEIALISANRLLAPTKSTSEDTKGGTTALLATE